MTGASGGGSPATARWTRQHLAYLGVAESRCYLTTTEIPEALQEHHLQPWSYAPDFTPTVQQLLQLHRPGQHLAVAVCGPAAEAAHRAYTAVQLAVGLAQHEREVVIVDGDSLHPRLAGLIGDPHHEGLVDLVRFGRSCRSLLWKPLERGPSLLALGSIPVPGALQFDEDTFRGVLHRVALHCQIAVYVTPHRSDGEVEALVRACDRIVYAHALDDSLPETETQQELAALQRHSERVAAVLLFADSGTAATLEMPAVDRPEPGAEPAEPVGGLHAGAARDGAGADALEHAERAPEHGPRPFAAVPDDGPPAATELPAFEDVEAEPAAGATSSARDSEPAAVGAQALAGPEPQPLPAGSEAEERARAVTRPPEEAREVGARLKMPDPEFAFDDSGRYSRTPLYMLITLVVLIGGFLGWVVWTQRGIERQVEGQLTEPPAGDASGVPDDAAASQQTDAGPDDAAAHAPTGAATPPQTGAPPAGVSTPEGTTGESLAVSPPTPPPPPPAPSASQPPPAPPSGVAYSVHVASYRKVEQADRDIANLRKHGFVGRHERTDLGSKGIWYRVFVGSFPSRAEAAEAREAILKLPEYTFAQIRRVQRQ